ncbi:MAG: DUF6171 family protein [Bacillota bacterium]
MRDQAECKGCGVSVRLSDAEVQRILAEYFQGREIATVDDAEYERRLTICRACDQFEYGTTCRHCGCLVQVRAKLADQTCPHIPSQW